jgi:hypothetical protein
MADLTSIVEETLGGQNQVVQDDSYQDGSYLVEKIARTGWVARQALKFQVAMREDSRGFKPEQGTFLKKAYYDAVHAINQNTALHRLFDTWYTYAFIGELTGYDQEVYCQIHNNHISPKKMTTINALVIGGSMFCINMGAAYLAGMTEHIHALMKPIAELGEYGISSYAKGVFVWNIFRSAYSQKTGKGLESICIPALLCNFTTYAKKAKEWNVVRTAHSKMAEMFGPINLSASISHFKTYAKKAYLHNDQGTSGHAA